MALSVLQRVINFTATLTGDNPANINATTVLLEIPNMPDMINYMMELEDSFALKYQTGDESGIITIGDAADFITKKLGG
jgi:hypothetical protein